jgi:hypothetical protein
MIELWSLIFVKEDSLILFRSLRNTEMNTRGFES